MVLGSIGFLRDLFINPEGALAFIFLIPFIILYLIKPKPLQEKLPSLMFILKDSGRNKINSFFRSMTKDLLLWIQLILLLAMILAVAKPYMEVPKSYLVEQTVIVIDTSASMQAGDKFDKAIDKAIENLGSENTIISIKSSPEIIEENIRAGSAEKILKKLEPTDTTSNIHDALRLAANYATSGVKIAVISDFKKSEGSKYEAVAAEIESKGAILEYYPITSKTTNVAIIDLDVKDTKSNVWIKNYNDKPETITLTIGDDSQEVLLDKLETKQVEFQTPSGLTSLKIDSKDELEIDNYAWTSTPTKNDLKVLVITNNQKEFENSNFKVAADLISKNYPLNINFEYAIPPKIPDLKHDLYIIYEVNPEYILPGYIKEINEKVSQGAASVIFSQEKLFQISFGELLPATFVAQGDRKSITGENTILTRGIEFGQASTYLKVASKENSIILAKAEDDPVIIMKKNGKGNSLYYGLFDDKSTFKNDPSYPVFWRKIMDFLTNRPDTSTLNLRTGTLISLSREQTIKLPDNSKIKTNVLRLEQAGPYVLEDRIIVANLISDKESDLKVEEEVLTLEKVESEKSEEEVATELTKTVVWIAIIMLFLELLYIKFRGDL